ncbi:MFS-type transporter SLC18B1-like isoform X2 [Daphnia pulex]|uniref:MFS-type transporter SLC18B1-like isoform X2 n=1 Tax=Daphnia pulex TaxID=6669 RepID=UPI001EDF4A0B|nr:MFS-type transporter SLC18B1-like isoform X2 [Daphnia pulex]
MESSNEFVSSNSIAESLPATTSTLNNFFNEPVLDISENNLCRTSPIPWTTMSDTIVVSPAAGLPALKVIVCSGTETPNHIAYHGKSTLAPSAVRSKSVSNLTDEKLKHSDEEILQMRNKLLVLAEFRNKAIFQLLEKNQKWTLSLICVVYFFCFCAISILSPFFRKMAVLHNISTSTYGLIFSIHPAVVFCTSPFIGHITPSIGPKFMFTSGVFLCGSCNLLFGTLQHIQDDTQFTILCFIVRGLGAVGASAFSTAGATYVANLFPDKICVIMGILETFIGLGFSIGPLIGGALFTLGGFQLPFYIMGLVMLLTLPFSFYFLPTTNPTNNKGILGTKVFVIFKIPAVFIICLVIAVSSSAWSVLEPTLIIHMEQFELTPMQLGFLFLVTSISYAISSPFWGWLVGKYDNGNSMMTIGLSVTAISLLLLGPSPILPGLPNVLWLNILSLVLIGVFVALAYVPTYQALLQFATQVGCDTELSTYSIIAGLWASMYSLGF